MTASLRERSSAATLLIANIVPITGIVFLGWDAYLILVLYWIENVITGVLNVFRMALCRGPLSPWPAKLFMIPFFCVHYGMFTFGHGVFVFSVFGTDTAGGFETAPVAWVLALVIDTQLVPAVAFLAGSHLFSLAVNFLGGGEYKRATLAALMIAPYGRVVVLHVTIIAGGGLVVALGSPMWAVVLMVVLKTAIDLASHRRSHRKLAAMAA